MLEAALKRKKRDERMRNVMCDVMMEGGKEAIKLVGLLLIDPARAARKIEALRRIIAGALVVKLSGHKEKHVALNLKTE